MTGPVKKSRILILGVAALVILTIIEWRPWHDWVGESSQKIEPIAQELPPEKMSEDLEISAIRAQLSPVRYTTVAAELGAKIKDIPFREGESFKEGQRLVMFDCSTQQAQYSKAKAAMAIAERNYVTNKKLLDLGSVGRIEYENSASEFQKAKSDAQELAAIVDKCVITAPFNGRVVEQKVRPQQFVQAGQAVLDILDSGALELEFIAPSKWITWLLPEYEFKIKVDETGKSYPAKVTRVGAKIDSISQTIKVAAVIDGEFADLTRG